MPTSRGAKFAQMENEDGSGNFLGGLVYQVTTQQEWVAFPVQ
jgi:hypothetical protein